MGLLCKPGVTLPELLDCSERRGICLPFPFTYLFCLSRFFVDEQQPSILFSSETKCCRYSRPASSKLAAWPSFSSLGRLHKAIPLPWGKNAIKRWHKHWAPVVAVPRKKEGGRQLPLWHACIDTGLLIGLFALQSDTGVNIIDREQWMWLSLSEWALTGECCPTSTWLVCALIEAAIWPCVLISCRQLAPNVSALIFSVGVTTPKEMCYSNIWL